MQHLMQQEPPVRADQAPITYVQPGQSRMWPYAKMVDDAPLSAHYGQEVARRLIEAMERQELGSRELARRAGITHTTINHITTGDSYPSLATLCRLEAALRIDLYPTGLYHRHTPPPTPPRT